MAKLKKFAAYKNFERPYTRVSKYKKKSFVRATINTRIARFRMGNLQKRFPYTYQLISKQDIQIRDNALESAREICNKVMEKNIGPSAYFFLIKVFPFHVLRENPLAAGAGADRFSTGMSHSFGKPIGQAARVRKGQSIFECSVEKEHLDLAKSALHKAASKLPLCYAIELMRNS